MGQPIIGHLVRKGFTVVVHDIDEGKREVVARLGAGWTAGPAELAHGCEVILVCVGFDQQMRELDVGRRACSRKIRRAPPIVAVLSTVHPRTVQ